MAKTYPVFQLRLRLEGTNPVVWRRLLVPGQVFLPTLHSIFQEAMGWRDSHLHQLRVGDSLYGMHVEDWEEIDEDEVDEAEVSVFDAFHDERRGVYDYDFGDSWHHEVIVESEWSIPKPLKHAVCVDGENRCPPEDVGGVHGYREFLAAIADPAHDEHESWLTWAGGSFDPEAFDVAAVNAALQRLR